MCDFRKIWLGFSILSLIFLIIACTLVHTNSIYDKRNPYQQNASVSKSHKMQSFNTHETNIPTINTSIVKDAKQITISGLFGSTETLQKTKEKFGLYFSNIAIKDVKVREGVDEGRWLNIIQNLAYYFSSSMEEGTLKYSKHGLSITGITLYKGAKEDIALVLSKYQSQHIKVVDSVQVKEPRTDLQKTKKILFNLLRNRKIEFENGKSALKLEAKPLLDNIANILQTNTRLHVSIEGHTDNIGNVSLNESLSIERAYAVKEYLVQQGISAARIETKGYGQTRPILPNTSELNRQKNRRVEFKIKGEDNV